MPRRLGLLLALPCLLLMAPLAAAQGDPCEFLATGEPCDDGVFCNGADFCLLGLCVDHAGDPCIGGAECAASCDEAADNCFDPNGTPCGGDGDPCTADVCDGAGSCDHPPGADGVPCDDGVFCNGADTCNGGSCTHAGNPCAAGGECADTCNEAAEDCFDPSGTSCTGDGNPCTDDVCNGAGACTHPGNTDSCDDGFFCTVNDTCSGGFCGGTPRSCAGAGDQCNTGACNEATDACEPQDPRPDGTSCNDGLFCNGADTCASGSCTGHAGDPCAAGGECADTCDEANDSCLDPAGTGCTDDANPCTNDRCNGSGTCVHPNRSDGTSCDDGKFCTVSDSCTAGVCGGAARDCGGGDACNAGACNEATDTCTTAPRPDGTNCNDGLFCNGLDLCLAGACTHTGTPCPGPNECADDCNEAADNCFAPSGTACTDDGNPCTNDRCDGSGTCAHPPNAASCNDGLFCNGVDTCSGGTCQHAGNPCPGADGDGDCSESCNEASDSCIAPDPNGAACSDGQFCTVGDHCTGGVCGGTPRDCSSAGNSCNDGVCNETTNVCEAQPKPNGTACTSDGLFCNGSEVCSAGACTHQGNPCAGGGECSNACNEAADNCFDAAGTACNSDGNPCTNDQCNGAGICIHPGNTAPCNDGLFCNGTDTCSGGACVQHAGNPCPGADGDGDCSESCNEASDACIAPDPDGAACSDGQFCTVGDHCTAGVCGGTPRDCSTAGNSCNDGVCNETTNVCEARPKPNGTACTSDGLFCNGPEVCSAGACTHQGNPCAGGGECSDACNEAADNCFDAAGTACNSDDNPCTNDQCNGAGICIHPGNTAPCNDGLFCNGTDTCSGGACVQHAGNPCPGADGDGDCTETCNEATDQCTAPDPDGATCSDGQFCTVGDHCTAGVCGGTPRDCSSAGNSCNDGVCNEGTDACQAQAKPDGTACTDDGLFCNGAERCGSGTCGHAGDPCAGGGECANACNEAANNCFDPAGTACASDGNPCTTDQCNGGGTCAHPNNTAPCNDGIFCNGSDTCGGGSCSTHAGSPCPGADGDGDCTESCNEAADACTSPDPDGASCTDGNACTRTDTCQAGSCRGSNPVVCVAQDQCHVVGTCDTTTGVCSNPVRADGTTCDDGSACTRTDGCQAGVCTGTNPVVCTVSDQCHVLGTCDPASGVCSDPPAVDGTGCNDSDACTRSDICLAGVCTGTDPIVCDTADPCVGTCNPANGRCTTNVRPDGADCNDGNLCTRNDTCLDGICIAGPPVVCVPRDQCHVAGVCTPATGVCSDPAAPDGRPCNDDNVCTIGDACRSASCEGIRIPAPRCCVADAECTDGIACTDDRCAASVCVAIPMDSECQRPGADCLVPACVPNDPGAESDGCILRAARESGYCTEDADPCTIDACRAGTCLHESDASGSNCPRLDKPFETVLELYQRASALRAALAAVVTCAGGDVACDVTSPEPPSTARLVTLVDSVRADFFATILTLGGRLVPSVPADPNREPFLRARLAQALVDRTPDTLRAFMATLKQARRAQLVPASFVRAERADTKRLMRGTRKLRGQLRRILIRQSRFAR